MFLTHRESKWQGAFVPLRCYKGYYFYSLRKALARVKQFKVKKIWTFMESFYGQE